MIIDKLGLMSDDQAVTVTAPSTDVIDLGADYDYGPGTPINLLVQVTVAFTAAGAATLVVAIETDDNSGFSSASVLHQTAAIGKAALVPGYKIPVQYIPRENERYIRVNYTVATGPMTAGNIFAGIVYGDQSNKANTP